MLRLMESTAEVLARRQVAALLIATAARMVGPTHQQELRPILDELGADIADAIGRMPPFGETMDAYLALDVWAELRSTWLRAAGRTLLKLATPTA